uniref:Uncharacterized protein n=1 Tax=Amphiprion ocellaris TaxID=80972 RepID=A0A3Q1CDX4_AMPOC
PKLQTSSHVLTFSARHPMIPRLYVMPWRRDMKHQRLLMKVRPALAGIPTVPLEESLCFCGRERLCHGQDSNNRSSSSSSSSSSAKSQKKIQNDTKVVQYYSLIIKNHFKMFKMTLKLSNTT